MLGPSNDSIGRGSSRLALLAYVTSAGDGGAPSSIVTNSYIHVYVPVVPRWEDGHGRRLLKMAIPAHHQEDIDMGHHYMLAESMAFEMGFNEAGPSIDSLDDPALDSALAGRSVSVIVDSELPYTYTNMTDLVLVPVRAKTGKETKAQGLIVCVMAEAEGQPENRAIEVAVAAGYVDVSLMSNEQVEAFINR